MREGRIWRHALHQAWKGRRIYLRILRKKHIGLFSFEARILLMPEEDRQVCRWCLRLLGEYLSRQGAGRAVLVITEETAGGSEGFWQCMDKAADGSEGLRQCMDEAGHGLRPAVDIVSVSREQMEALETLCRLHPFDKRMVVAALDRPAGRGASRLLGVKGTQLEELVAVGIYGMLPYRRGGYAVSLAGKEQADMQAKGKEQPDGCAGDKKRAEERARRVRRRQMSFFPRVVDLLLRLTLYAPLGTGLALFSLVFHRRGEQIVSRFRRKKGRQGKEPPTRCLCPYQGTGDVYLAAGILKTFTGGQPGEEIRIGVIGKANGKICRLFGWEDLEVFSKRQMDSLVRYLVFTGQVAEQAWEGSVSKEAPKQAWEGRISEEAPRLWGDGVRILHHDAMNMNTGILDQMRNVNGLDFYDLLLAGAFGQKEKMPFLHPVFPAGEQEVGQIFERYGLLPGRTVVLAPYSYTLDLLPDWVWERIASGLKQWGYRVCTNCGSDLEAPVEGTAGIFFPFSLAVPILEQAGYFVGVRSGFCDVVSSARCRKIILYQGNLFWGDGTSKDYFSLEGMGLCEDVVELTYEGIGFYKLIDEVLGEFEECS